MGGDYASVKRRQLERGELSAVVVRVAILMALTVTYVLVSSPEHVLAAANVIVAAVVVVQLAYSVVSLRLLATASFGATLADVSAVLDAVAVSAFLWIAMFLSGGGRAQVVLAAAVVVSFPLVAAVSVLRHVPRNVVIGAVAQTVGSLVCAAGRYVSPVERPVQWVWAFVPVECVALGVVLSVAAYSTERLMRRHLVTADLQRASRRLRMTMEIVQVSIANLGQFVNNLERVSAALAEGARAQARSIDRISAAVTALNSSQEQIYRSSEISAKTIGRTVDSSEAGNRVVKRVIEEVGSISEVVDRMVSSLELIDDIADNTNLLALNANIEASRGGPESMGFSVVADEIRNLAEQSQETAVEVGRLVKQIAKVISTADASSKNAGEVFDKINSDLAGYSEYVSGLHLCVQEQLKANRDVQRSISRIHDVTIDNTQAADRVGEVVGELQKEVAKLKALVDGKVTETAALS